jgi:uncharacterized protein (DUF885 family)
MRGIRRILSSVSAERTVNISFPLCTTLPADAPASATVNSASTRFQALHTREWNWRLAEFAWNPGANAPIPDRLPKLDPATQARRLAYWQQVLAELAAIPREGLSATDQVNYDVYRAQVQGLVRQQHFRTYEMPANSDSSFWSDLGYTARRNFRSVEDYDSWIAQMRDLPRYFDEQTAQMKAGLERGFTPPRVTIENRSAAIEDVVGARPEDTFFYTPFKAMLAGVPESERARLRAEAVQVIRESVQPAYAKLLHFWNDEYVPSARTTTAASDLPDGPAFYQSQIAEYTTLELTPTQIHEIGMAEVAALHVQMLEVMKQTGFKGGFRAFLRRLNSDPRFQASSPQDLLNRAAWISKVFDGKASQYFGRLPRGRFAIKPVPDDIAPFYTAGRGGPDIYMLNTYNVSQRPLYNLTALTLHESAPGHAFQMSLAREDKSLPDFRRYTYISAYGEGWALYAEWLGQQMGMYETPYERFGMLGYQVWRAARLVVDTGLHGQGWTRQQAIDYLFEYTALPLHEIKTEVDRYISWPAQSLSYYLGEMAIRRGREKAELALGEKFNLRAFHDGVLALGCVPLPVLDRYIDRFIAGGGVGPYPDEER